ncbi:MAG: class I SAM-dependent methyltransferase, partial [Phycisphaeraceae bacterium]|nr:class I SAM-dependent methyltransferase [Phycisphaeraceae bacterium]
MTDERRSSNPGRIPPPPGAEGVPHEVFHDVYRRSKALWVTGRPQPAVMTAIERGWFREGPLFDAGCGTGENAIAIARAHPMLEILAMDAVPEAVELATVAARAAGVADRIRFEVADLRAEGPPPEHACVLDAGVLHVFSDADRPGYLQVVHDALHPGGTAIFIVFSTEEIRPGGPRRLDREELVSAVEAA